jgi:hypothetical protein
MFSQQNQDADPDAIQSSSGESKSEAPVSWPDAMLSADDTSVDVTQDVSPPPDGGWKAWLCSIATPSKTKFLS